MTLTFFLLNTCYIQGVGHSVYFDCTLFTETATETTFDEKQAMKGKRSVAKILVNINGDAYEEIRGIFLRPLETIYWITKNQGIYLFYPMKSLYWATFCILKIHIHERIQALTHARTITHAHTHFQNVQINSLCIKFNERTFLQELLHKHTYLNISSSRCVLRSRQGVA